ncbi:MAG: hypothetical protein HC880_00385 [Bacteroidia bacterium]|nr:hypothetical protein [Bacteroidia bacterium]
MSFPDSGLAEAPVRREWQTVPLLGAGLQLKLLGLVNVQFTLLYNPLHDDEESWRGTPWVTRLGFGF